MEQRHYLQATEERKDPLKNLFGDDYNQYKAADSDDGKSWDSFD